MNEKDKLKRNDIFRRLVVSLIVIVSVIALALAAVMISVYITRNSGTSAENVGKEEPVYIDSNKGAGRRTDASVVNALKHEEKPKTEEDTMPETVTAEDYLTKTALPILDPELDIYSSSAIMLDRETGDIIFQKEPTKSTYPASLTKIMTAVVGLELCPNLNASVTITDEMLAGLLEADASVAGFVLGEEVQYIDLFYGMMLPSGADAANAIAISLCGSIDAFVEKMNDTALRLGMVSTNYTNVSGLHDVKMRTTASDVAMLFDYALNNNIFRNIVTKERYTTAATNKHENGITVYSTMFSLIPQTNFSNGAKILGGKTGTTTPAGQCLASFGSYGGREYILVTLGAFGYAEGERYNVSDAMTMYSLLESSY